MSTMSRPSRSLKVEDIEKLSRLYEVEFNQPELHDRVLVFDVCKKSVWVSGIVSKSSDGDSIGSQVDSEKAQDEIKANTSECVVQSQITTEHCDKNKQFQEDVACFPEGETVEPENSNENLDHDQTSSCSSNRSTCSATDSSADETVPEKPKEQSSSANSASQFDEVQSSQSGEIIRQHKFFVHGSWLALQSSYFRSLLFSGMKESSAKEVHMKIPVSEEKSHLFLLEAMYKIDTVEELNVDDLLDLLLLAHKYDVEIVFKKCKYCLTASELSLDICEQIMRFIKVDNTLTNVEDLASALQPFLVFHLSPLDKTWKTESFKNLCEPSLRYLLASDKLKAACENTIFHALMHWFKHNDEPRNHAVPSLLSVIRFEFMPMDYLYNVVQHHPTATKLPDFTQHYMRGITYHALPVEIQDRLTTKPVKRQTLDEEVIYHTWVIKESEVQALVQDSSGESNDANEKKFISSDDLWCCGYQMQLRLEGVRRQPFGRAQRGKETYCGSLCLHVLSLSRESAVHLQWKPESGSFSRNPSMNFVKYNKENSCSVVDIDLVFEIAQKKSDGFMVQTKFGQSGFTFGSFPSTSASSVTSSATSVVTSSAFSFGGSATTAPALGSAAGSSTTDERPASSESSVCIDLKVKLNV